MKIRLAVPEEAEECWNIRNLSIREGCKPSYSARVLEAWTPDAMPEHYREVIKENPFFVVEKPGVGLASLIIETIKDEAMKRGLKQLTLSATPNAKTFYEKHGFVFIKESTSPSRLAQTDLRCMDMSIQL